MHVMSYVRKLRSNLTSSLIRNRANGKQMFSENNARVTSAQAMFDWNVMEIFHGIYSAVMLNTPIVNPALVMLIWKKASFKVLIDGGGNRLYDLLINSPTENWNGNLPHVLSGDFDSIRTNVLEFFQEQDVEIVRTPDQNETDFFKGLKIISQRNSVSNVIVVFDNGGRLDHLMGNLHVLFKCSFHESLSKFNIFLLGDRSLTWLLRPGFHVIHIPQHLWTEKSYCGLIPVGQPSYQVTTEGLKWNLHNAELQFGKLVSSSNAYDITSNKTEVHVSTDNRLIWTMAIDEKICDT